MKTLVTGGAEFIGSHLVDRLLRDGHDVTVVDNFQNGSSDNLMHCWNDVRFVQGDIRDRALVFQLVHGMDRVFHLAAHASVPNSSVDLIYDFETNAIGTFKLVEAARRADVQRFVYASTSAVYGEAL